MNDIPHAWEGATPYGDDDGAGHFAAEDVQDDCIDVIVRYFGLDAADAVSDGLWNVIKRLAGWTPRETERGEQ